MKKAIDRRTLLGSAAGLAGTAALSMVPFSDLAMAEDSPIGEPSETIDADLVVVGAGISGLAATVQASELGLKVIELEANDFLGGNGLGTEGILAVGSPQQQEMGIKITLADIVANEQDFFKYKVDALFWKDMVEQSADTLVWLEGNGVQFSGRVDDYPPLGSVKTMHWWKDGQGVSYVQPMADKATELGAQILTETRARELVLENGIVKGVLATRADGSTVKVSADAVILASGGFADSPDKLREAGVDPDLTFVRSFGGHMGDGLAMAVQAGAKDLSVTSSYLRETTVCDVDFATPLSMFFFTTGSVLWVNSDAERFADESCLSITSGCQSNANSNQGQTYTVFSQAILNANPDAAEAFEAYEGTQVVRVETIADAAKAFGLSPDALEASVEKYNNFCEAGVDEDFGKSADALVVLEPPFLIAKMSYCYMSSIGGIKTDRHAQVISENGLPIPGLFAAGSDGCQLYGGTYTISVCSSYNGNNVYSGRNAARTAADYLKG